jgi:plasmid stability protein
MNLTITVDEEVQRRARIRALEQGTSVNAVLREFLASYAGGTVESQARSRLAAFARKSRATSGAEGRRWTRTELYDARFEPDDTGSSVYEPR